MLEADDTDIWKSHDKYPEQHDRISYLHIYYPYKEDTVDKVGILLVERNGKMERALSIDLPDFTREDISRCKDIMTAWHNTGIIEITNCGIDTNQIPWEESRW